MHIRNDPSFFLTNRTGAPQVDKVPVLPVWHQVLNQFEIPLVESEEDPASPQEIPRENFELWIAPLTVLPTLLSQMAPIDKVPVLLEQHQVLNRFEILLVESEEDPASLQEIPRENLEL
nr:hypothetical protein [Tanacetum cinerariifolium]